MVREQSIQSKIMNYIHEVGGHVTKYNVNGYGSKGEPDLFASLLLPKLQKYPIAVYIEVKKPGGKLSPLQAMKVDLYRRAGHLVLVAESLDEVKQFIAEL